MPKQIDMRRTLSTDDRNKLRSLLSPYGFRVEILGDDLNLFYPEVAANMDIQRILANSYTNPYPCSNFDWINRERGRLILASNEAKTKFEKDYYDAQLKELETLNPQQSCAVTQRRWEFLADTYAPQEEDTISLEPGKSPDETIIVLRMHTTAAEAIFRFSDIRRA